MPVTIEMLRAAVEALEAQYEAMGAQIEALAALLPDEDADEPEPAPAPVATAPGAPRPPCEHKRTELAGGFGGVAQHAVCSSCGASVPPRR